MPTPRKMAVQMTMFHLVDGLPRCCEACLLLVSQPEQGVALGCKERNSMKDGCPECQLTRADKKPAVKPEKSKKKAVKKHD